MITGNPGRVDAQIQDLLNPVRWLADGGQPTSSDIDQAILIAAVRDTDLALQGETEYQQSATQQLADIARASRRPGTSCTQRLGRPGCLIQYPETGIAGSEPPATARPARVRTREHRPVIGTTTPERAFPRTTLRPWPLSRTAA